MHKLTAWRRNCGLCGTAGSIKQSKNKDVSVCIFLYHALTFSPSGLRSKIFWSAKFLAVTLQYVAKERSYSWPWIQDIIIHNIKSEKNASPNLKPQQQIRKHDNKSKNKAASLQNEKEKFSLNFTYSTVYGKKFQGKGFAPFQSLIIKCLMFSAFPYSY